MLESIKAKVEQIKFNVIRWLIVTNYKKRLEPMGQSSDGIVKSYKFTFQTTEWEKKNKEAK